MSLQPVEMPAVGQVEFMCIRRDIGVVWFVDATSVTAGDGGAAYDLWADRWTISSPRQGWRVTEKRLDDVGRRWDRTYTAVMSDFGELVEVPECPVL